MIDSTRVVLGDDELARLQGLVPRGAARGDRYPAPAMVELDSETLTGDRGDRAGHSSSGAASAARTDCP